MDPSRPSSSEEYARPHDRGDDLDQRDAAKVEAQERDDRAAEKGLPRRWCGICFLWRPQGHDGRCVECGNDDMTGGPL
jgi:hypothetical protein